MNNTYEHFQDTSTAGISAQLNIQHLDNREQYISHLEDLLLIYTSTIQNLTYMLGE